MARRAGLGPEGEVLAVGIDGEVAGEEPTGMGTHRGLDHGQHPVGGHLHQVGPRADVVHHPVHGGHDPPSGGQRTPYPLEAGRLEGQVARAVGDGRVEEGDVGRIGLDEADAAEGGVDLGVAGIVGHGRAGQRTGGHGGHAAGGRLQPLEEGEERPVLHLHVTTQVGPGEVGVGREAREDVARVARDHLVDQATPEEQRPEARQAEHHQGEAGLPTPPVPDQVAGGGRPARVVGDDVQRVARPHVGDGFVERADLVAPRLVAPRRVVPPRRVVAPGSGVPPATRRLGSVRGGAIHDGQASGRRRRIASSDDQVRSR